MNIAEIIVNQLLENDSGVVVVCAGCDKEFGIKPPPNASHSYCKRHMLEMYDEALQSAKAMISQNPKAASRVSQLMQSIRDLKGRPDNTFPPDLREQQHASVAQ